MAEPITYPRTLFVESQGLRGRWLLLAAAPGASIVMLTGILTAFDRARGVGMLLLMIVIAVAVTAVLCSQKLVTVVTSHELRVGFWLLRTRRINLADIARVNVETYEPIREFGGWGVRWSLRDSSTGYTIRGNRGVRIHTIRGEKLLIGSQRAEELLAAIESGRAAAG